MDLFTNPCPTLNFVFVLFLLQRKTHWLHYDPLFCYSCLFLVSLLIFYSIELTVNVNLETFHIKMYLNTITGLIWTVNLCVSVMASFNRKPPNSPCISNNHNNNTNTYYLLLSTYHYTIENLLPVTKRRISLLFPYFVWNWIKKLSLIVIITFSPWFTVNLYDSFQKEKYYWLPY